MAPKLYYCKASPPSRASLLAIKALGIDVELIEVNIFTQEQLSPTFIQKNPFHTVPTLEEDDGFIVWNSHAINAYLVDQYGGQDDSLYPKEPKLRATIDQRLHFDSEVLWANLSAIVTPLSRQRIKAVPKDKADEIVKGYTLLETLLEKNRFLAGPSLTLADFSAVTTVTVSNLLVPVASNRFPHIHDWINRMKALPYYSGVNDEGLTSMEAFLKSKLAGR